MTNSENPIPSAVVAGPSRVWLGWALTLASTLAFSLATPLGKVLVTADLYPAQILMVRYGSGALLLALSLAIFAPDKLRIDRRGLLIISAAGLVNGGGSLLYFAAFSRIDASVASMIFSLNPLVVLGLLALRGEKLTHRHTVRVILGLAGAWLLLGPTGNVDLLGSLMAFASVVGFALELCLMQWYLRDYDSRTLALYILISMWLLAGGLWLAQGMPWNPPGLPGWTALGVLTTVSTYFAWLAMFIGIRYIGSGQVAMLMLLDTVFAVSWSILFLGERLTAGQFIGGGLILLSAALAAQRLRRVQWRPRWRALLRA